MCEKRVLRRMKQGVGEDLLYTADGSSTPSTRADRAEEYEAVERRRVDFLLRFCGVREFPFQHRNRKRDQVCVGLD